jgi:3-methylcrotonyl-CoA carboxylase alpha subunit
VPETDEPPLIVKAAAGGGGRGMRIVRNRDELATAVEAARREARAGFGDDRVFLERYLARPRHVEIQLLADTHGTVLALGERECSIQRRHQKVLEESPSTALDPELRAEMSDAAVRFARAVGYVGAGTAEFVLDGRAFFFLELNGRIQVEHPVTEAVTGLDLVQWQLHIARGEQLDVDPVPRGAAVEVRLYAEDPVTFLPQAGRIERLRLPASVRVESAVAEGDDIPLAYDPMIAKLIAAGADREEAFDRLAAALAETEVGGPVTNLPFLRWLVAHPVVRAGETTTAFLSDYPPLSAPPRRLPSDVWQGSFRLNLPAAPPAPPPDVDSHALDHRPGGDMASSVAAPMPGTVIRVHVHEGSTVRAGEPLVVLEAMKMETPLTSPYDGVVRTVHVKEGDRVAGGAVLVDLDS